MNNRVNKINKINNIKKMNQLLIWKIILWSAPITGIIITIIANVKINKLELDIKIQEKKKTAISGFITPKNDNIKNLSKITTVLIGTTIKSQIETKFLKAGYTFRPFIAFGSDFPIFIKLTKQGNLSVNCNFRDINGNITAEMKNNEWEINPNNYFKRNYDNHGLEVIDKEGITKFQIDLINNNTLKICGVFRDTNGLLIIDESIMFVSIKTSKEKIIKQSEQIPYMFLYPSDRYFGERVKK